jgi:cytochrome c oxidase subunit 4
MTEGKTSPVVYFVIFAALLALTLTTVLVARVPLGPWHVPVALGIAVTKGTLVALFFMHLLHGSRMMQLVLVAAVFWLAIMLTLTFADYLTRGWYPAPSPGSSANAATQGK